MAHLIRPEKIEEGTIINSWLYSRLIRNNKNALIATTGATGSGKSYQNLRMAELWYHYYFKNKFPQENICFSIDELMRRLVSGKLKRGEILIFEEAGANFGSLDFQNKISKLFSYILQSFRSMNIALFFNLPYLSMLNKQARLLIHTHFVTSGIDYKNGVSQSKAFFRQVNQDSGKIYNKYLRIKHKDRIEVIKRFNYMLPSKEIVQQYEAKKQNFVMGLSKDFLSELDNIKWKNIEKNQPQELSPREQQIWSLSTMGIKQTKIAEMLNISDQAIHNHLKNIKFKLFFKENKGNRIENGVFQVEIPIHAPI